MIWENWFFRSTQRSSRLFFLVQVIKSSFPDAIFLKFLDKWTWAGKIDFFRSSQSRLRMWHIWNSKKIKRVYFVNQKIITLEVWFLRIFTKKRQPRKRNFLEVPTEAKDNLPSKVNILWISCQSNVSQENSRFGKYSQK